MTDTYKFSDERKIKIIVNYVSEYFGLSSKKVFSYDKHHDLKTARQIIHYLCRKNTNKSAEKVGEISLEYGRQRVHNHSTVLHSVRTVTAYIDSDKEYRDIFKDIEYNVKTLINKLSPEDVDRYDKEQLIKNYENLLSLKEQKLINQRLEFKNEKETMLSNIKNKYLKELISKDEDTINFCCETRLKPFLKMLDSQQTNKDLIAIQHATRNKEKIKNIEVILN